ncbi:MAG: elongation factor G [Caldilineaceae bacterium SB0675_bin_29]|uniref:Elongation factor G n=1 Tax=Caldilineaceae bacterium SB0675_bin_29 TaxID=2605266 RepID=A0A6B1G1D4_9CHLR|nr:elongation factor G [Caldilineaceae bacterium SB0675_bin_29]
MADFSTDNIRNVTILGHGSSGKTSLVEALLFNGGGTSRVGRVEDGSTVSDWDEEEQRRGISINLAVVPVEFQDTKLNLVDTPGYLDFVGEVISGLSVSEAGLVLLDSVAGVEVGTELAWEQLDAVEKPRMIFVNKMDRENANFANALASASEAFSGTILPFQLPIGSGESFEGVVNLVDMKAYMGSDGTVAGVPADMEDAVAEARQNLVDAAAETDDELIMKYLEGEELTEDEVRQGLKNGVQEGQVIPVFCGSAIQNIGLFSLARALTSYVPSPADKVSSVPNGGDDLQDLSGDAEGPVLAYVFKTIVDRYVGRMSYVRVLSGTLTVDKGATIQRSGDNVRLQNMFHVSGKELEAATSLTAGDIGVLTKMDGLKTSDSLSEQQFVLPPPEYPRPLYSVAVMPATKADSAKMGQGLQALAEENPTLQVEYVQATKQNILQGMGDTHVDVAIRSLDSKFGVKVDTAMPRVPYQETVTRSASAHYRHKKQTGGAGQFADVELRVEPLDRGDGFAYDSEVFGGAIPSVFIPSIEKGIRQILDQGVIAGYPIVDVKAIVFDGKHHPVDSKDIAFQTAGREVFKIAMQEARPVLLEPIYTMRVTVPDEFMGDVMGDLNNRRGRVLGMENRNNRAIINAEIPLAEILRYGTDLRSMTQGRGIYTIEFGRYEPVPSHLADQVISQSKEEEAEQE